MENTISIEIEPMFDDHDDGAGNQKVPILVIIHLAVSLESGLRFQENAASFTSDRAHLLPACSNQEGSAPVTRDQSPPVLLVFH